MLAARMIELLNRIGKVLANIIRCLLLLSAALYTCVHPKFVWFTISLIVCARTAPYAVQRMRLPHLIDMSVVARAWIIEGFDINIGLARHYLRRWRIRLRLWDMPPRIRLLDLPAEVRNIVYHHMIDDIAETSEARLLHPRQLGLKATLLRQNAATELSAFLTAPVSNVCQQIRTELLEQVFREAQNLGFTYRGLKDYRRLDSFLGALGRYNRNVIHHVHIRLSPVRTAHGEWTSPARIFCSALSAFIHARISCNVTFDWKSGYPDTHAITVHRALSLLEDLSRNRVPVGQWPVIAIANESDDRSPQISPRVETFKCMFRRGDNARGFKKLMDPEYLIFL